MHKWVATICIVLGVFATLGAAFWAWFAAGFGAFSNGRGSEYIILLAAGPLSLLPAGIVGRKRPFLSGAWLLAGSLFCYFWHLGVDRHQEFVGFPVPGQAFEDWLPVLLICPPMSLMAFGFLWVGRGEVARRWTSPVYRRRAQVVGAAFAAAGLVVLGVQKLREPVWTITVTPEGQPPRSVRFNPREHLTSREPGSILKKREAELKALFSPMLQPSDRTLLGNSEWKGTAAGGTSIWTVERNSAGLIRVLQNGSPVDQNWLQPVHAMQMAVNAAERQILTQAWREHDPPRKD
jgi:hypothetical protein